MVMEALCIENATDQQVLWGVSDQKDSQDYRELPGNQGLRGHPGQSDQSNVNTSVLNTSNIAESPTQNSRSFYEPTKYSTNN